MTRVSGVFMWMLVVILAIVLQIIFIFTDTRSTPTKVAVDFSKAYFLLDDGMSDYICSDLSDNDCKDVVNNYLLCMSEKASELGLQLAAIRRSLIHVRTETLNRDSESASIRIKASSKTHINPLFMWIAELFHLGRTYYVDDILELIKEGDSWKVCGSPFDLCS